MPKRVQPPTKRARDARAKRGFQTGVAFQLAGDVLLRWILGKVMPPEFSGRLGQPKGVMAVFALEIHLKTALVLHDASTASIGHDLPKAFKRLEDMAPVFAARVKTLYGERRRYMEQRLGQQLPGFGRVLRHTAAVFEGWRYWELEGARISNLSANYWRAFGALSAATGDALLEVKPAWKKIVPSEVPEIVARDR